MKGRLLAGAPLLVLVIALLAAQAVPGGQAPTLTYTISLREDGSAVWNTEYRTPLVTDADNAAFQNYSAQVQAVYLPDYTDLMKRSAAGASTATGRPVSVSDFSADTAVQSGPTGSYGVVHFRCTWTGFAEKGDLLTVGDVFVGGLYLAKDHALVIRPPPGYGVAEASPDPDSSQDGLVWYGMRSFGAGEPRVVFSRASFPLVPAVLGIVAACLVVGAFAARRRFRKPAPPTRAVQPAAALPSAPAVEPGDRILALLAERGGALYQSEIVDALGLPKSTVSEAINRLNEAGRIEKVRKGRENLIRIRQKS
ncbi:MAG TPA: MarR family transcriptional regulator [Methanomicrobiales archaeon]|nr:MarR family transcriptional regulator [Methanomicrobiales archaeon]